MTEYPVYDALNNALSHLRGRKAAALAELKKLEDIEDRREGLRNLVAQLDAEIAHIEPRLTAHAPPAPSPVEAAPPPLLEG